MDDSRMTEGELEVLHAPFIATAELWSGKASEKTPSVGMFMAERLWNALEATVLMTPAESGQNANAVLGIPWYIDATRSANLLLSNAGLGGTFEVWHVDPERDELRLSSGYFGKWEEFKRITALTRFHLGEGLPGRVWRTGCPVLLEDLSESKAFLRAAAAQSVGLQCGLGLPVRYASGAGVVTLLSSRTSPIGRSIDIWRMNSNSELEHLQGLVFATSAREHANALLVAQRLAIDAATQLAPSVLQPGTELATRASMQCGFAWPSRDDQGVIHVATVVG
jgi:hypothetical protein